MDITQESGRVTYLSLCSGYDGIGLGLHLAGVEIAFTVHVEVEAFAVKNLADKIQAGAMGEGVVYPDVKTFPFERFRGGITLLSAGFPCQPFSAAGRGDADSDPRHLFPFIKRGISSCQPDWVFLENVDGIISKKLKGEGWDDPPGTPILLHVLRELERVGYKATWGVFSASEVGAPHQRKRVFILAHRVVVPDSNGDTLGRLLPFVRDDADYHIPTSLWPSRPGQEQWWWEPPRVLHGRDLDNTVCIGLGQYGAIDEAESNQDGSQDGIPDEAGQAAREDCDSGEQLADPNSRGCSKEGEQGGVEEVCGGRPNEPVQVEEPDTSSRRGDEQLADSNGESDGRGRALGGEPNQGRSACQSGSESLQQERQEDCNGLESSSLHGREGLANTSGERLEGARERGDSTRQAGLCHREGSAEESQMGDPAGQRLSERKEGKQFDSIPSTQHPDGEQEAGEIESEMGGDSPRTTIGVDYAELLQSKICDAVVKGDTELTEALESELSRFLLSRGVDSRTDELKLLGNGVVPCCAARAFTLLYGELEKEAQDVIV